MPLSPEKKKAYFKHMESLLDNYTKVFIVCCDNVGSNQIQQTRLLLRGKAVLLMGKNTLMRKVLTTYVKNHPGHPYQNLIQVLKGNVGFVFTNGDLSTIKGVIESNKVPAPAKVGGIAPIDVIVPAGPTTCDPGQTSFFQVLQIPTKINKGRIEITNDVHIIKAGNKIGNSEAALLQKLDIKPFTFGLIINSIYDNGVVFDAKALELTNEAIQEKFLNAVRNIAAISLAIGYPTTASLPHSIANAFKTVVALTVECEGYTFPKAEPFKQFLLNPSAFVSAAPAAAATTTATSATAPKPVEEKKPEPEEEEGLGEGAAAMFGNNEDY